MAVWTLISDRCPKVDGTYRAKCGVTGDTFWVFYQKSNNTWYNRKGLILFGVRDRELHDSWRPTARSAKYEIKLLGRQLGRSS